MHLNSRWLKLFSLSVSEYFFWPCYQNLNLLITRGLGILTCSVVYLYNAIQYTSEDGDMIWFGMV